MTMEQTPYQSRIWKLAHGRTLELGPCSQIMGILNATPDSFSDGGRFTDKSKAIDQIALMVDGGASIIDLGGESTRPDAKSVTLDIEQQRVLPLIELIKQRFDVAISIDTYHADTAELALDAGAHIVNDITGLQQTDMDEGKKMAKTTARFGAGICLMHNSRDRRVRENLIDDQFEYLGKSLNIAASCGIADEHIVLDPGFGFGKDADDNLSIFANFEQLMAMGFPLLCGTSRKRFIGSNMGVADTDLHRDIGTASTNVVARMNGASIFRVHDVTVNMAALNLADAIISSQ